MLWHHKSRKTVERQPGLICKGKGFEIMNKMAIKAMCLKNRVASKLAAKKTGSQTLDWLIIAVIVVVIGVFLFAIMRTAMPDLFNDMIDKVRTDILDIDP